MASSPTVMDGSSYHYPTNDPADMGLFRVEPEIVTSFDEMSDDLRSFAELHEDPVNDAQIELYVIAHFLLCIRTRSREHLEQAVYRTEGWVAVTDVDDPDRARRLQLLDMISARMYELMDMSDESRSTLVKNA